jgi:hypothetical protein
MAINEAGLPITKEYLDQVAGQLAVQYRTWYTRVAALQRGATGLTDQDLTDLGYSAGGVTKIRAGVTNMVRIKNISTGSATLGVASDLTAAMELLAGID